MPLGGKFDAAAGLVFFKDLQRKCHGDIGWNFLK